MNLLQKLNREIDKAHIVMNECMVKHENSMVVFYDKVIYSAEEAMMDYTQHITKEQMVRDAVDYVGALKIEEHETIDRLWHGVFDDGLEILFHNQKDAQRFKKLYDEAKEQ